MHGRSTIWFPLVLLALLAALTYWIQLTVQPPQPKRDGSSRHDPDYTVSNFVTNKADSLGNPHSTLAAVSMVHFPDDDSTELVRPRYTQYSLRKPTVQIQGQRGKVTSNGEEVYFMDNVKVVREATKTKGELTVFTEMMHIRPDQNIADTDRPVRILQAPHTVVTGTGMEMNNQLHTFKLFHNVHVHYQRPSTSAKNAVSLTPSPVAATRTVMVKKPLPQPNIQSPKIKTTGAQTPAKISGTVAAGQTSRKAPHTTKKAAVLKSTSNKKTTSKKLVKKSKRRKARAPKTAPPTEQSNTRIRRHYETSTSR